MAKVNPLVLKIVFIGVPFLIGVALLPTNSPDSVKNRSTKSSGPIIGAATSGMANTSENIAVDGPTNTFRPGMLPTSFTNGQEPWAYAGTVDHNGSRQAHFQNRSTGQSVFLSPGDSWLGLRLISISGDTIVVSELNPPNTNPSGRTGVSPLGGSSDRRIKDGTVGAVGYSEE